MIPWLQAELDTFRDRFNSSPHHCNKNKILPQGAALEYIREHPEDFDARDYKVTKDNSEAEFNLIGTDPCPE